MVKLERELDALVVKVKKGLLKLGIYLFKVQFF
jgi:hypothetical protein